MGHLYEAACRECGNRFEASEGGGFHFYKLRCDTCGDGKEISHGEIREPLLKHLENHMDLDLYAYLEISSEYYLAIELMAGKCPCRGQFRFGALVRCPKCHSTDIAKGKTLGIYI